MAQHWHGMIVAALAIAASTAAAAAPIAAPWVESWGTALPLGPVPPPPAFARPPAGAKQPAPPSPVLPYPATLVDQTVRMTMRTSVGGRQVRLTFRNAGGGPVVVLDAVHAALSRGGDAIDLASDRTVTFGGSQMLTLFPGDTAISDPVPLAVPALADVAVSIHVRDATPTNTVHSIGLNPGVIAQGNVVGAASLPGATPVRSYFWLSGLSVPASAEATGAIATLGDSITDGYAVTPGSHGDWPALLAARLHAEGQRLGVVNLGISGNRILRFGAGESAGERFDADVLARPGLSWVILLEGINDINMSIIPGVPRTQAVEASQIIAGMKQLVERAHAHGLLVAGATILPTKGLSFYSAAGEAMRTAVNQWIRTSRTFDAVIDFDQATRDPADPLRLRPSFDPGDHVHPNDAGNKAMAAVINIESLKID